MAIFDEKIEIRCKGVHCVDLVESFPTSIYLQKSASIQSRTSLSKLQIRRRGIYYTLFFLSVDYMYSKPILYKICAR